MYTRSYAYTYTPDAADANFALAQCARRSAAAYGLQRLHFLTYIARRRYAKDISLKSTHVGFSGPLIVSFLGLLLDVFVSCIASMVERRFWYTLGKPRSGSMADWVQH